MDNFENLPKGFWKRYWLSFTTLCSSIGLFLYSNIGLNEYSYFRYHSGVIPILLCSYFIFFLFYYFFIKKFSNLYKDSEFLVLNRGIIHLPRMGRMINLVSFPLVIGLPLTVGTFNLYDTHFAKTQMKTSEYFIQVGENFNSRFGKKWCYAIKNEKLSYFVCLEGPKFDGINKAKVGVYKGVVGYYFSI